VHVDDGIAPPRPAGRRQVDEEVAAVAELRALDVAEDAKVADDGVPLVARIRTQAAAPSYPRSSSATRSATAAVERLVFARGIVGMIDASAT